MTVLLIVTIVRSVSYRYLVDRLNRWILMQLCGDGHIPQNITCHNCKNVLDAVDVCQIADPETNLTLASSVRLVSSLCGSRPVMPLGSCTTPSHHA